MPESNTRTSRKRAQAANLDTIGLEMGNKPPQALDVEEAVLGAMLIEPSCVDQAMEELTASCFYDQKHRMIFEAMTSLVLDHTSIDIITVSNRLKEKGDLETVGGLLLFHLPGIGLRAGNAVFRQLQLRLHRLDLFRLRLVHVSSPRSVRRAGRRRNSALRCRSTP